MMQASPQRSFHSVHVGLGPCFTSKQIEIWTKALSKQGARVVEILPLSSSGRGALGKKRQRDGSTGSISSGGSSSSSINSSSNSSMFGKRAARTNLSDLIRKGRGRADVRNTKPAPAGASPTHSPRGTTASIPSQDLFKSLTHIAVSEAWLGKGQKFILSQLGLEGPPSAASSAAAPCGVSITAQIVSELWLIGCLKERRVLPEVPYTEVKEKEGVVVGVIVKDKEGGQTEALAGQGDPTLGVRVQGVQGGRGRGEASAHQAVPPSPPGEAVGDTAAAPPLAGAAAAAAAMAKDTRWRAGDWKKPAGSSGDEGDEGDEGVDVSDTECECEYSSDEGEEGGGAIAASDTEWEYGSDEGGDRDCGRSIGAVFYPCEHACPQRSATDPGPNGPYVQMLDEVRALYGLAGSDKEEGLSFAILASVLKAMSEKLERVEQLSHIKLGDSQIRALKEMINTGRLRRLEVLRRDATLMCLKELRTVLGVGQATAREWCSLGIRSVAEAQSRWETGTLPPSNSTLSKQQEAGLKYRTDLEQPIPRATVEAMGDEVRKWAESAAKACRGDVKSMKLQLAGGYRRGKEESHDVDMLICLASKGKDGKKTSMHKQLGKGILKRLPVESCVFVSGNFFINNRSPTVNKRNFVCGTDVLRERDNFTIMAIVPFGGVMRRLDIIIVPPRNWVPMLLNWTGNAYFNRSIRRYAKDKFGITMEAGGIIGPDNREGGGGGSRELTPPGKDYFETEEDVFELLGLDYLPPEMRCC